MTQLLIFGDASAIDQYLHEAGLQRGEAIRIWSAAELNGHVDAELRMVFYSGSYDIEQAVERRALDLGIPVKLR